MLGMRYYVSNREAAVVASRNLFSMTAPSDAVVVLTHVEVTQDTQVSSETLQVTFQRPATVGSGNNLSTTIVPAESGFAAAGATAHDGATTDAAGGETWYFAGWNVLAPLTWHPVPEERFVLSPGEIFVIDLGEAPGAAMDISTYVAWMEIGG